MFKIYAFPLVLMAALIAMGTSAFAGAEVTYDFVSHFPDAKIADDMTASPTASTVGGVEKRSIFLHPAKDEATATYKVALPTVSKGERLIFAYSAGLRDGIKTDDPAHPFDGVKFALRIDGKEQFTANLKEAKWVDEAVDLTPMAGKQIEVVFATHPNANTNFDWAVWGEPRILKLSNGLMGSGNTAKTSKGVVVLHCTGANRVEIIPTGIPKGADQTKAAVKWSPTDTAGPQRLAVIPFDFTSLGATGVELRFTDVVGAPQIYEFDPHIEIASFGPANALVLADKPTEFRCVVKNTGDGILHAVSGAKATVSANFPASAQAIGDLLPGQRKVLVWPNVKLPAGTAQASVAISGQGINKVSAAWDGEVLKTPTAQIAKATKAECTRLSDGTIVLQNPSIRVLFLRGKEGYGGWIAYTPQANAWKPVASGGPLGKVVTATGSYAIAPKDAKVSSEPSVKFTAEKKIGQTPCSFAWTFALNADDARVTMTHSMTSDQPVEILHFSGPMIYAGDHSFGSTKDEGLFPGLEYLLSEASSGTANAHPPYDLRTVPHPNKVTMPLMAVRKGNTLVTLEWDPLQKWDGTADRPSAVFASPNFLDGEDNHKMGLFAPSVPEWTSENHQIASKPYTLQPGKTLSIKADLIVKQDSRTVLDAVDTWVAGHRFPAPPEPASAPEEYLPLCDTAYFGPAWDDAAKAWKHTNTGPTFFDPMIATCIWGRANYYLEPEPQKRFMDQVGPAVEKAKDSLTLDVALLAGGVPEALDRMGVRVAKQISAQSPDGSWPFTPDKEHEVFGKPGDTSSGFTANGALEVLRYALVSGDLKARAAGLKALKYLDTQTRPEGAQVWELQLHVPDILASSRLVDAYLCGYQLTDDKKYLDRAVYWAKSGLPFVYMWNASDRPIMRYGTIPVYGVTWFDGQPWFGICVQWCGLEYAYSIMRLGYYDNTLPWKHVAEGILKCAVQQQEYIKKKYPEDTGMYPDAFNAMTGEEAYHWDLNPRLVSRAALQFFDADVFPRTAAVTDKYGNRLAITAPANIVKLAVDGEFLSATIIGAPKATLYILLSGMHDPMNIGTRDRQRNLQRYESDLDAHEEGFRYYPDKALTVIKVKTVPEIVMQIDLLGHMMYQSQIVDPKKKTDKK